MNDLVNRFTYHKPDSMKANLHEAVRHSVYDVAEFFEEALPAGRELSLAITKLEEAMFWANAAVARN